MHCCAAGRPGSLTVPPLIIDLLAAQAAVGAAPGAQSVSNDGYAVTFASNASVSAAVRQEAAEILRTALGSDPHDLLYRGLD